MSDRTTKPNDRSVAKWIGPRNQRRWTHLVRFIEDTVVDGEDVLTDIERFFGIKRKPSQIAVPATASPPPH
jgi:hypothetical protein